jgi:putative hydrolase of the HAD superfamily
MSEVTALFWDMGGVFLNNSWDRASRQKAAKHFGLGWDEFEDRHQILLEDFVRGRIGIDRYIKETVCYRERPFSEEDFKKFMFDQSQPIPGSLEIIRSITKLNKYLMCTINNDPLDLNIHRIEHFKLRKYFSCFFSSSFVGCMKPEQAIYQMALRVTHRKPEETIFIDERLPDITVARQCGMRTIQFRNPDQLLRELKEHRVL